MSIKNIVFDLGGVFIDIHYHKTRDAFISAGVQNFDDYFQQSYSNPLFADLEMGKISPEDFYDGLREQTGLSLTHQAIEHAWNAMLGDFRMEDIAKLPHLSGHYNIYLLSNTNFIHWQAFSNAYRTLTNQQDFDDFFKYAYYSHELGLRKPDVQCYQQVMQNHNMLASETLFIDDTLKNIVGAEAAGMITLHLTADKVLQNELRQILLG